MADTLGIDFGTTNSVMAVASHGKGTRLVQFPSPAGPTQVFRSLLFFDEETTDHRGWPTPWAGSEAIERYHEMDGEGRLLQSMKSFLGSRHMNATQIFGASVPLEKLIGMLLTKMREHAEKDLGTLPKRVVVGRPVQFAWTDDQDDTLPIKRLRNAFALAGFDDVTFEYEPVAAAYHHFRGQTAAGSLVLVADFGGGTTDFSVLRWGDPPEVLGIAGVGIAGDALDAAIVLDKVAPQLGKGATYRSIFGRDLVIPAWIYTGIKRWHELSVLKSPKNMRMLLDYQKQMAQPDKLGALIHLVENNVGYALYRSIAQAKETLSSQDAVDFRFEDDPLLLSAQLTRPHFEGLIQDELNAMERSLDGLLDDLGVDASHLDRCFLTGGTAHVPAVLSLFERRIGADRIHVGDHHTSVASGLALRGLDES